MIPRLAVLSVIDEIAIASFTDELIDASVV
jgi:hypothetical protein